MNVRWASLITIRSGFITRRIEARVRSRRISFIAIRLRTRPWTSPSTSSPGSSTSIIRAIGFAAATSRRSHGKTFSSHQCAMSGKPSRRRVSPVGAQSTITTSNSPDSWWRLICRRLNSSSMPGRHAELLGGDVHHPAVGEQGAEPALDGRPVRLHLALGLHLLAPEAVADRTGSGPSSASSESERLCAGSVESTTVRRPGAAQRRAVAAATLVLPTPPLPV